jgi:hypothetical protein
LLPWLQNHRTAHDYSLREFVFSFLSVMKTGGQQENDRTTHSYDAFGVLGTTFWALAWKTPIFYVKAAPNTPTPRR